jgi:hypothetical protein
VCWILAGDAAGGILRARHFHLHNPPELTAATKRSLLLCRLSIGFLGVRSMRECNLTSKEHVCQFPAAGIDPRGAGVPQ